MKYIVTRNYFVHTDDGASFMPDLYVDDKKITYTGLVDKDDNPICRVQDPIGFDIERTYGKI